MEYERCARVVLVAMKSPDMVYQVAFRASWDSAAPSI